MPVFGKPETANIDFCLEHWQLYKMLKKMSLIEITAKAEQDYGIDCSHLSFTDKEPDPAAIVIYKLQNDKGDFMWLVSDVRPPERKKA